VCGCMFVYMCVGVCVGGCGCLCVCVEVWICGCVGVWVYVCVYVCGWVGGCVGVWLGVSSSEHIYMENKMLQVGHIFILKITKKIICTKNIFNIHIHILYSLPYTARLTDYAVRRTRLTITKCKSSSYYTKYICLLLVSEIKHSLLQRNHVRHFS
jgi:hypothetical protein